MDLDLGLDCRAFRTEYVCADAAHVPRYAVTLETRARGLFPAEYRWQLEPVAHGLPTFHRDELLPCYVVSNYQRNNRKREVDFVSISRKVAVG